MEASKLQEDASRVTEDGTNDLPRLPACRFCHTRKTKVREKQMIKKIKAKVRLSAIISDQNVVCA